MHDEWHAGDWMQTFTGRKFFPFDPKPEDVDIVDIAHHLSMQCRYNGACKQFYSTAEHSVLMARCAEPEDKLRALMHDAAEAYIGDLIRPIKKHPDMAVFTELEARVERAICTRFNLPFPLVNAAVKELDERILHDEREQVMTVSQHDWSLKGEPLGVKIEGWVPAFAKWRFLQAFRRDGGVA